VSQVRGSLVCCLLLASSQSAIGQSTGTFLDRHLAGDFRVVSYNVFWDSIFPEISVTQAAKFSRVVNALNPDVLNLQEIDSPFDLTTTFNATDVANLMNSIMPLSGDGWYTYQGGTNVIVSRYPLAMTRRTVDPHPPSTSYAIAMVDLPDDQFAKDFYFMNSHFKCCGDPGGAEDVQRQRQADGLVNWMRDARTPDGSVDLPVGTPMAVVGDLNMVGSLDPLNNLISGNIVDELTYGPNSSPDWDGTPLADAHPLHNVVGPESYTWRNNSSGFAPGRLDYVLYTDSVVQIANRFVLNTAAMTPTDRAATGLQTLDVMLTSSNYDHLPLVVDFRFPVAPLPGDYNSDDVVDAQDYDAWKSAFGTASAAADGNGDGIVDAADYSVWRDNLGAGAAGAGATATVPEPAHTIPLAVVVASIAGCRRRCPRLFETSLQSRKGRT